MPHLLAIISLTTRRLWLNQADALALATYPVLYLAAPENRELGMVKALRKPPQRFELTRYLGLLTAFP